jgi:hypothetical protein
MNTSVPVIRPCFNGRTNQIGDFSVLLEIQGILLKVMSKDGNYESVISSSSSTNEPSAPVANCYAILACFFNVYATRPGVV